MRRALIYPPLCDICVIGFSGADEKEVSSAAELFAAKIAEGVEQMAESSNAATIPHSAAL